MARVMIGLPIAPDERHVDVDLLMAITRMIGEPHGHTLSMVPMMYSPIDNCRSAIVNKFLEMEEDYLLFIDNDNPPKRNVLELVDEDKDIIAFPTLMWSTATHKKGIGKIPLIWNVFDWYEEEGKWGTCKGKPEGLKEIDAGGTGCMLIARRVLEKVRPAFHRSWYEDGTQNQGSDLLFCKNAKAAGFKVWTHYDYQCSHMKLMDLFEVYRLLNWRDISHATRQNINSRAYWNRQWDERSDRLMPLYEDVLEEVRSTKKNGEVLTVLDYGCGRGDLLGLLSEMDGVSAEGADISDTAVSVCKEHGLEASLCDDEDGWHDVVVMTEVLEHVDDDAGLLEELFTRTNKIVYTVPWNCLPPGLEPEHRRVYNKHYVARITPHLKEIRDKNDFLIVVAEKDAS